jgi:SAM-dependent methyltransferase
MTRQRSEIDHYDAAYYSMRYGRVITDPDYYRLSGEFWKYSIVTVGDLTVGGPTLDWGSGPGHVSAAFDAHCYDPSPYIQAFLKASGRNFYTSSADIPEGYFQTIISSHSLEHSLEPAVDLGLLKRCLSRNGRLLLLLPIEPCPGAPVFTSDENQHFFVWNFQAITNLLLRTEFRIVAERIVHGPTGLGVLGRRLGVRAVRLAWQLGRLRGHYRSILVVAEPQ